MLGVVSEEDEITLWLGSCRYYMGRMTYAVSNFCDLLIRQWPCLNEKTRILIMRDIENEIARDDAARLAGSDFKPLGHDCDREAWDKVRELWAHHGT